MKKLFLSLIFICIILTAIWAFAAGSSMTVSGDEIYYNSQTGSSFRVMTIIFTADDADGSIPDLILNNNTASVTKGLITGWQLSEVLIDCTSGVTPTEDSDLYVYQDDADLLDGNGVDEIDNTALSTIYAGIASSGPWSRPVTGDLTITATQAATATNEATGIFKLTFK